MKIFVTRDLTKEEIQAFRELGRELARKDFVSWGYVLSGEDLATVEDMQGVERLCKKFGLDPKDDQIFDLANLVTQGYQEVGREPRDLDPGTFWKAPEHAGTHDEIYYVSLSGRAFIVASSYHDLISDDGVVEIEEIYKQDRFIQGPVNIFLVSRGVRIDDVCGKHPPDLESSL